MRTTKRTSSLNPAENFYEVTSGDSPSKLGLSMNAKGKWQPEFTLYFPTPDDVLERGPELAQQLAAALAERFPLAGD